MQRLVGTVIGVVVLVLIVLIIVDVVRTPAPTDPAGSGGNCTLVHRIVLPDTCVCSKPDGTCGWTSTRPYLFFFTQAASCPTLGCDVDLRQQ